MHIIQIFSSPPTILSARQQSGM